ncbi:MAG: ATP-binding protein [Promethearchaeota archaeon]
MVKSDVRVLIVEDSEDDFLLIKRELRKCVHNISLDWAKTKMEYVTCLQNESWDAILSDYNLGEFSGLDALQILKTNTTQKDIPFILISGMIGEELAVQAMHTGVNDYILKDKLSRLNFALERELEDALIRRERRNIKKRLVESEKKFKTIFQAIPDLFFLISCDGIFLEVRGSENGLFSSPKAFLGKNFKDILVKEHVKKAEEILKELFMSKQPQIIEFFLQIPNNETVFYESRLLYFDENKTAVFIRNITQRKQMEKKLSEFNQKLGQQVKVKTKELNAALEHEKIFKEQLLKTSHFKSEFIASMSHELRTPLNSIIGFTDVILERISGEINPEQEQFLMNVKSSGLHLLDLINDILDIAKIESGKVELNIVEVNLSQIIEQIKTMIKPMYEKKQLAFEIKKIDKETMIWVDRLRFKEILFNLLSNAVKYTPKGSIKIEFSEDKIQWRFDIIDTGIGIKYEDYHLVFQEFKRIQSVSVDGIEGTGLGLSLTKKLVELHGGTISFTSEFGVGSTFTFTILKQSQDSSNENLQN